MMESGLDVRTERRVLFYKQIKTKHQDEKIDIPIGIDFIQKILIWMSSCYLACTLILMIEFNLKRLIAFLF